MPCVESPVAIRHRRTKRTLAVASTPERSSEGLVIEGDSHGVVPAAMAQQELSDGVFDHTDTVTEGVGIDPEAPFRNEFRPGLGFSEMSPNRNISAIEAAHAETAYHQLQLVKVSLLFISSFF